MHLKSFTCVIVVCLLLVTFVHAYAPPPPPPPACAIKQVGCYDNEDRKQAPGSILPKDFNYYVEQNACLTGSCTCSVGKFLDDAKIEDPDEDAGACACIQGTAWADINGGGCCGNEQSDCGVIQNELRFGQAIENHLCAMDSDLIGSWVPANPNKGDIAFLGCNNKEYLSDGNTWIACDSFTTTTIENHQYICTGNSGQESWVECCGSSACNSANGGKRLTSGNSVTIGSTVYYCLSDSTFDTNLDNEDKTSCEGAEFDWTGSLCCSEADDTNEYYNDNETKGGCWNGETVFTGDSVPNVPGVANFDGFFFGCDVTDQALLNLKDYHTEETLVENKEICYQDERKFYLCNTEGEWEVTNGKDFSNQSTVPEAVKQALIDEGGYLFKYDSGCCGSNRCWDGNQCVDDQRSNPNAPAIAGYRCVEGEWSDAVIRESPEEDLAGFCPETSDCLVTPFGNPDDNGNVDGNPQCISDGQYIERNYCDNGEWTSRTKFVAQTLQDIVVGKDEFVIFCDAPQKALNNIDYQVAGTLVQTLINADTNNFCILTYDDRLILGTTLNKGLESDDSLLDLLSAPDCDNTFNNDAGAFLACGGGISSTTWYNSNVNSLLYSSNAFTLEHSGSFIDDLRELFNNIISGVGDDALDDFDTAFLDNLQRFDKLYLEKNGAKEIRGTVDGFSSKRLVIEYTGFTTDICEFIDSYNTKFSGDSSRIACEEINGIYYVLAEGNEFTKIDPDAIWNDLTSKLRVS